MPKLREVVDPDTGEVYHVETTRQAKRRHQRSAGVPKPTIGQINAADIWNRQEEKIKKDREREERRKKNKEKEEAKAARLKELQEEKLRLGRISIEDTWGKVNASQNRLHAFFGAPKKSRPTVAETTHHFNNSGRNEKADESVTSEATVNDPCVLDDLLAGQDLDTIFTGSPLSPELKKSTCRSPTQDQLRSPIRPDRVHRVPQVLSSAKRGPPQSSAAMMPPPKRSRTTPASSSRNQQKADAADLSRNQILAQARSPLSEMTPSQLNTRANEKPDLLMDLDKPTNCWPVATQVVRDTLLGLCSQDLDDDFVDDKENASPSKTSQDRSMQICQKHSSTHNLEAESGSLRASAQIEIEDLGTLDDVLDNAFDELEDEDFDDGGIDDESLLALAATQQLKSEFSASSKRERKRSATILHPQSSSEQDMPSLPSWNLGDSFTMDNISDEDLLQGLEVYETNTQTDGNANQSRNSKSVDSDETNCSEIARTKKRRVLPWVKNPITDSFGYDEFDDDITPSMFS